MASNHPGGPTGRSPFPARRRAPRTSFESFTEESHSPFLNNLLRFSPKNASLSPLNRNSVTNAGQPPRGGGRTRGGAFFAQTASTPVHGETTTTTTDPPFSPAAAGGSTPPTADTTTTTTPVWIDGVPLDQLRALTHSSLLSSPPTAVLYASLVYSKTHAPRDALVLARAHCTAHQMDACLRLLDAAGLLLVQQQPSAAESGGSWQAVLVACQALAYQEEWNMMIDLLEDVCRSNSSSTTTTTTSTVGVDASSSTTTFGQLASSQPLEDTDTIGWRELQRSIPSPSEHEVHPLALLCWHRGHAYYETGCSLRATTFWKLALRMDCRCQPAWESLLQKNLLSVQEAHHVVTEQMEFRKDQEWLRALYMARIELTPQEPTAISTTTTSIANKMATTTKMPAVPETPIGPSFADPDASSIDASSSMIHNMTSPMHVMVRTPTTGTGFPGAGGAVVSKLVTAPPQIQKDVDEAFADLWDKYKLQDAPQILAMAARRAYRRYEWKQALQYCQDLAQLNPSLDDAAFCYVATLIHLGHKRVLFRLAHEWVSANPQSASAWFAVGGYYYCIGRYHVAQRHFCRATRLDSQCPEAWIAFGCSFAACDESDQALASFRAAQRLSPGEHTSLLYMGMEYVRTNHTVLAHYFLHAAKTASGGDPLCLHELGVLAAHTGDVASAVQWYRRALATTAVENNDDDDDHVDGCTDPYWEPTLFNLGHALRKLRRYPEAEQCYRKCIALCPDHCAAYTALAFTYHLMGALDRAISLYHQALSLKPDDPLSTDMLHKALQSQVEQQARRLMALPPLAAANQPTTGTPRYQQQQASWKEDSSHMSEGMDDSDMDMR